MLGTGAGDAVRPIPGEPTEISSAAVKYYIKKLVYGFFCVECSDQLELIRIEVNLLRQVLWT